jgi:hypothetical protein
MQSVSVPKKLSDDTALPAGGIWRQSHCPWSPVKNFHSARLSRAPALLSARTMSLPFMLGVRILDFISRWFVFSDRSRI